MNPMIVNSITQKPFIFSLILSLFFSFFQPITLAQMRKRIHPTCDFGGPHKRLRRLPHVFSKVLELPFPSDTNVLVQETANCLRFVVGVAGNGEMRVDSVEIYPGVSKVVVRRDGNVEEEDTWRFRLPREAVTENANVVVLDGEMVVTVPKTEVVGEEILEGGGRLVIVH